VLLSSVRRGGSIIANASYLLVANNRFFQKGKAMIFSLKRTLMILSLFCIPLVANSSTIFTDDSSLGNDSQVRFDVIELPRQGLSLGFISISGEVAKSIYDMLELPAEKPCPDSPNPDGTLVKTGKGIMCLKRQNDYACSSVVRSNDGHVERNVIQCPA
jgi:hypothetical protein